MKDILNEIKRTIIIFITNVVLNKVIDWILS